MHKLAVALGLNALVLKEKQINPEGPLYVKLVGRKGGLIDFLLNLIGINCTSTIEIFADRIVHTTTSLSGKHQHITPMAKVSDVSCGFSKPIIYLVIAVLLALFSLMCVGEGSILGILFFILLAAILGVAYALNKSISLSIISCSAASNGLNLKRSVIENQSITQEDTNTIVDIITDLTQKVNA